MIAKMYYIWTASSDRLRKRIGKETVAPAGRQGGENNQDGRDYRKLVRTLDQVAHHLKSKSDDNTCHRGHKLSCVAMKRPRPVGRFVRHIIGPRVAINSATVRPSFDAIYSNGWL